MSSLANNLYSDSASLGVFYSKVSLAIGIFIGIIMIVIGIKMIMMKNKYTKSAKGTVEHASCNTRTDSNGNSMTNCDLKVTYTVNGKRYSDINITTSGNETYNIGESVTVMYDPSNPEDATLTPFPTHMVGWILIGISVLIVAGGYLSYYMASHYKLAGAAMGVGAVAKLI